jgi:hypothetical protein
MIRRPTGVKAFCGNTEQRVACDLVNPTFLSYGENWNPNRAKAGAIVKLTVGDIKHLLVG